MSSSMVQFIPGLSVFRPCSQVRFYRSRGRLDLHLWWNGCLTGWGEEHTDLGIDQWRPINHRLQVKHVYSLTTWWVLAETCWYACHIKNLAVTFVAAATYSLHEDIKLSTKTHQILSVVVKLWKVQRTLETETVIFQRTLWKFAPVVRYNLILKVNLLHFQFLLFSSFTTSWLIVGQWLQAGVFHANNGNNTNLLATNTVTRSFFGAAPSLSPISFSFIWW